MSYVPQDSTERVLAVSTLRSRILPNGYDLMAFALMAAAIALVARGGAEMKAPSSQLAAHPVMLDLALLPGYALRTTLRMFAAIIVSLIFTFVVGTLAAKSRRAALVIIPALDILQSVPVLGFLTFAVTFFLGLFPGSQLGAECAAIFAIFTAQAWNMAFSFYQSLRTVPRDLDEVSRGFGLSPWQRFWRLDAPFAAPGLIWNTMMSMSGGWFFVVASEAITVGNTTIQLPGIGSWLALAIDKRDFAAVGWAVLAMAILIFLYDQLVFRPIVAWADKFRFELTAAQEQPQSIVYDALTRTKLLKRLFAVISQTVESVTLPRRSRPRRPKRKTQGAPASRRVDALWLALILAATAWGAITAVNYISMTLGWSDVVDAFGRGLATLARVVILVAVASLIWTPVGVFIGLRPRLAQKAQPIAQFLAAFPANVLFPVVVVAIVATKANPNIWLSPLMVLGTQWYILFNVIAGASAFPSDLKEAATIFNLRSWIWWRSVMLPGVLPYYVTGALTATGGCWNAAIVAEVASWGHSKLEAYGLGSYIADASAAGDFRRVVLGVGVMSIFVIALNRSLWRPLYAYAERRMRFD